MPQLLDAPTLGEIEAARECLRDSVVRTPLVPLNLELDDRQIYLKLENLQPIGSFKLRGAGNAMKAATDAEIQGGVYTASAGNMAQGVAWNARRRGVPCSVIVPEQAPRTKLESIRRLGAKTIQVPFEEWWNVIQTHRYPGMDAYFIHPVSDRRVMAGNGTIGLEILEDLPDVEAVVVPFGGGGLSCGIASALASKQPAVPVFASEVSTAAPLSASLKAGAACKIQHVPSFVDGIGGSSLLREMWPLASRLLAGALVVTPEQTAAAIRLLVNRNHVVAEGAAATSVAAALESKKLSGKIVCVVSGGNIDTNKLSAILDGRLPD